jgi:hypothetical protein
VRAQGWSSRFFLSSHAGSEEAVNESPFSLRLS